MRTTGSPNNYQLWVVNVATRAESQITTGPGDESQPAWSPDGRHIVHTCGSDLCVADYLTGAIRQLTTGGHRDFDPSWSPDGSRIIVRRHRCTPLRCTEPAQDRRPTLGVRPRAAASSSAGRLRVHAVTPTYRLAPGADI